mmetsp:Transcript_36056/g.103704  ORF Transcript_36056/g.103704 Transcript_36056/m.103704 type:complete len:389 (+) Transcript_36056:622-1788(+)
MALALLHHVNADIQHVRIEREEAQAATNSEENASVKRGGSQVLGHRCELIRGAPHFGHGGVRRRVRADASAAGDIVAGLDLLEPTEDQAQRPEDHLLREALPVLERDRAQLVLQVGLRRHDEGRVDAPRSLHRRRRLRRAVREATPTTQSVVQVARADDFVQHLQNAVLDVAVQCGGPWHPRCLAGQQRDHALVALLPQGLLQRHRLAGELDQLLEVRQGRLAQIMQVVSHLCRQAIVDELRLWVVPALHLLENPLHAEDVLVDLVPEVGGQKAAKLLRLVRRTRKHVTRLLLHLIEESLLPLPQRVAVFVVICERHRGMLEHEGQRDAPQEVKQACPPADALLFPRRVREARQLHNVHEPRDAVGQGDGATDHQHDANRALQLDEVL